MTPVGFPHSETFGSTLDWQLPEVFRGLHRPSSPACPKASTSCPESLIIYSNLLKRVAPLLDLSILHLFSESRKNSLLSEDF
jgi:hypothetical protein